MNLNNFKEAYKSVILESTDDAKLKNYIRSIVEEMLDEKTKSKDYDVSKKHHIHAGNYPSILYAINRITGKKSLGVNYSAKESQLDSMENALNDDPNNESVIRTLKTRLNFENS